MIDNVKLNKGEWAEFYVMLKLLGEGKLYTANALLQKNADSYLDIIKVIREESETGVVNYIVDEEKDIVQIRKKESDELLGQVDKSLFDKHAVQLFEKLNKRSSGSIAAPQEVCEFAKVIYVSKPKAPAVKALARQFGGKNDIFIEVRDPQTTIISVMGFSIKSKFAQAPTLFNAGTSSQLLYKVNPCDDSIAEKFNNLRSKGNREWSKCREYMTSNNIELVFTRPMYQIYADNLSLVTESMPNILAWCYKDVLMGDTKDIRVRETVQRLSVANPLRKSNADVFYMKNMKDFLMAGFTGMTAGRIWDGKEQVNGGYIVVMDNGEVLCYHSNDRESFRDYLYNNTFFEYVSTKKYKWSEIFKENGEFYLPLNSSIRFCKDTR